MKIRKAAGPTGVVSEMMKEAGGFGSRWITDLINNIVKEGCIPDDWSILVHMYKGKGDPLVCGSYRTIKLLDQPMKVLERVLEKRIRCQVSIDNIHFGFMPGKGTTDAIFIMRQVQEKYKTEKKKLYYAFVDLEKAFDRVPREVVRWALRKLGVDEWLIRTVMALYTEACTIVRTDAGLSESWFASRVSTESTVVCCCHGFCFQRDEKWTTSYPYYLPIKLWMTTRSTFYS